MTAALVPLLGALTCLACAVLLLRGYARSRARLLLWSGLCFAALSLNNLLLGIHLDTVFFPDTPDLRIAIDAVALVGVALLLYGLIWDVRE
ncbi:MAG TPA: DUF5985 family protein [Planctomycetota bacterium]|nr:DUF5985 family protein [Planctomycetota bacterium]